MSEDLERLVIEKHQLLRNQQILQAVCGALVRRITNGRTVRNVVVAKGDMTGFLDGTWQVRFTPNPTTQAMMISIGTGEAEEPEPETPPE